jgi:hypothetical protein
LLADVERHAPAPLATELTTLLRAYVVHLEAEAALAEPTRRAYLGDLHRYLLHVLGIGEGAARVPKRHGRSFMHRRCRVPARRIEQTDRTAWRALASFDHLRFHDARRREGIGESSSPKVAKLPVHRRR